MSFEEIKPYKTHRGWTGCAMSITPSGVKLKLRLILKPEVMTELGIKQKDRVTCLRGTGSDQGKILIRKGDGFSVAKNSKAGGRVDFPVFDNLPQEVSRLTPTAHEFTDDGLVVTIPKFELKKKAKNQ